MNFKEWMLTLLTGILFGILLSVVPKNACAEELVLEKKPQVSSGTKGS